MGSADPGSLSEGVGASRPALDVRPADGRRERRVLPGQRPSNGGGDRKGDGAAARAESNVTVPLTARGEIAGARAFGSMRTERTWPPTVRRQCLGMDPRNGSRGGTRQKQ